MAQKREYLTTHPWLTFSFDLRRITHTAWMHMGEIISKSMHIANAPISPERAEFLYNIYLAKGTAATTAIEGNTLSEDQVQRQISGGLDVPPSQEYLKQEVKNILDACNHLTEVARADPSSPISGEFIADLNRRALAELKLEENVVSGEVRRHSVVVNGYRGAPVSDCHFLIDKLCDELQKMMDTTPENKMFHGVIAALFAHVYIALIHPYGDGNGRTSRLLEVYILLISGFPMPTCQLLSNHYNKTRANYYRNLDAISKSGGNIDSFFEYALQGFVDGLKEQVELIQGEQSRVTWINYIHSKFSEQTTPACKRRRDLAIAISYSPISKSIDDVFVNSPKVARAYALLDAKTLTRDLNELTKLRLISRERAKKIRPRLEEIQGFWHWRNEVERKK